ncbi:MAG: phosphoglucosamine mutase [Alphaproteobacteria bacterium]|nr:phosphoglucosamine mutase [Alphaproteobacteria bacterium]
MAKNKWFGTDGVRGVANTFPMTADFAMRLGSAAAQLICTKQHKVAIAKDTRISGDMLEAALVAGFTSQGIDVICLGIIPTPALTFLTPSLNVDMSVMITASHNPFKDNGIKLISADGSKLSDTTTAQIEQLIEQNQFSTSADKIGKVYTDTSSINLYKSNALKISSSPSPLQGLKVVLDCANGCFSSILPDIFASMGAEISVLSNTPNGTNINLNCGSQHTENMCAKVISSQSDIGIAVDGDGDRIIVCDEHGNRIDGDQIIAFLGQYYHQNNLLKGNTVVATIVSNPALDRFLANLGISCIRSAVGERYVIEEMQKYGSNIGGEESGHMVVSDYSKTGDAMIAALTICLGLKNSGQKMSNIFPLFTPMLKKRVDSRFSDNQSMQIAFEAPEFKSAIAAAEESISGHGKILIRKSGTEPKIQVWVWSDDADLANTINQSITSTLTSQAGFEQTKDVL